MKTWNGEETVADFVFDEDIYKLIVDQLDVAVITDQEGRYVHVTKSWEEYYGLQLKDIKGKFVREVFPTTKIHEALKTKESFIGVPAPLVNEKQEQGWCSYIPIIKEGQVVAGFIHVLFHSEKTAVAFSRRLNAMMDELNYYKQEVKQLRKSKYSIDDIIGESPLIGRLKEQIQRAAKSSSTVLIEGETGSGKELVAHSIHDLSQRAYKPLIKINCAAIPAELFESELFGYEYGAFTGADKKGKKGKFEMASGGSLFLDEINQMPLILQPKLLRALQESEIERIGGKESIPVDIRLIAASNTSLEKMVSSNAFRSDLFYRLNVLSIRIPALRERTEDIPLLVDSMIEKFNFQLGLNVQGIQPQVLQRFGEYDWPGNIRELQNVVERGMNMALTGMLEWKHFDEYFQNKALRRLGRTAEKGSLLIRQAKKNLEKEILLESLAKYGDNKTQCAREMGISRTLLYKKMKEYGIKQ
ncbi:AAA domain-containing protein [Aminipila butyrica]|uniref:AAA domain-containing protein n=1 Tax=Aminipila butyrica TaxID=433296 RepID=A0A858BYX9_9FIRM|nr:sigma 54-interacting transcriptional regulator [Aminipila butyrica]QIB69276.1 AAA domain-containing protein [Aminipila butyrica]